MKKTLKSTNKVEFRMEGEPFSASGTFLSLANLKVVNRSGHNDRSKTAGVLRLMCNLLIEMQLAGWSFVLACDLLRNRELSTCFYRHNPEMVSKLKSASDFMTARADKCVFVCFSGSKMRIFVFRITLAVHMIASSELLIVNAARNVQVMFRDHLQSILHDKYKDLDDITEQQMGADSILRLSGHPWKVQGGGSTKHVSF